jgi:H2-forming N5,N10-methylenetetrahydromethanopterin dehydrogenase-like enzyme
MTRGMISQEAMITIERLAALCNTGGIDDKTKEIANKQIQELLSGPVQTSVTELKSAAAGIVTLT